MIICYMNLKYPCNLWKPLGLIWTLQNRIEYENVAIKETSFD
jgi:hypothetical protein